jgi:tRNA(Ile)-lysidine synthase
MIKLQGKLPRNIAVAVSGGVDSMAALDFLKRSHNVTVLHFHHGTGHADQAHAFVTKYCRKHDLSYQTDNLHGDTIPPGRSREDYWREKRYKFLEKCGDIPVITCHHLDDCVETWLFSSLHGNPKIIPYRRHNIIRPFRMTRKRDFELWAHVHNVPYLIDPSNADTGFRRNYIRHEMMPHALEVNPGIHKMISKKVKEDEVTS